jgi:hypothetical protein
VSLGQPTLTLAPPYGVLLSRWVTRFSLGRGFSPLFLIPALNGRPIPVGLHPPPLSLLALRVCPDCDLHPRALLCSCKHALHDTALHPPDTKPFAPQRCYRYRTFAAQARQKMADQPLGFAHLTSPTCFLPTLSRHSLAWILSPGLSAGSTELATGKGTVLPSSVFLVLGTASPARAVAHN